MAELLVKAKAHWMDSLSQQDVDALSDKKKNSYNARSQIGDVILVRPDGWKWGKCECLPGYIVIKLSGTPEKDLKYLEEPLVEINEEIQRSKLLKKRKYKFPSAYMALIKSLDQSIVSIPTNEKTALLASIEEKIG